MYPPALRQEIEDRNDNREENRKLDRVKQHNYSNYLASLVHVLNLSPRPEVDFLADDDYFADGRAIGRQLRPKSSWLVRNRYPPGAPDEFRLRRYSHAPARVFAVIGPAPSEAAKKRNRKDNDVGTKHGPRRLYRTDWQSFFDLAERRNFA